MRFRQSLRSRTDTFSRSPSVIQHLSHAQHSSRGGQEATRAVSEGLFDLTRTQHFVFLLQLSLLGVQRPPTTHGCSRHSPRPQAL